ncbi:hypothetical protein ABXT43_05865 [Candidatus Pelagibacter sp. Uisw_114]
METFTYKGISEGKYIEGDIEAINLDEASHLLKEKKIIITNINKSKKKKRGQKRNQVALLFLGKKKLKYKKFLYFQNNLQRWLRRVYLFYRS